MSETAQRAKRLALKLAEIIFRGFMELVPVTMGVAVILVTLRLISVAPEFGSIVFSSGLIALAIYKRPPTTISQHFDVQDLTMEHVDARSDTALALKVLTEMQRAAERMKESGR